MDSSNYANVLALAQNDTTHKVFYLRQFDPALQNLDPNSADYRKLEVPDPYSLSIDHFEAVYEMVDSAITGLLAKLAR